MYPFVYITYFCDPTNRFVYSQWRSKLRTEMLRDIMRKILVGNFIDEPIDGVQ